MIYTYIVFDKLSGLTKIGNTRDIKKRLSTLSTSNLNLSMLLVESVDIEKELHLLFKDKRVKKEWYDLTREDIKGIQEIFNNKIIEQWN